MKRWGRWVSFGCGGERIPAVRIAQRSSAGAREELPLLREGATDSPRTCARSVTEGERRASVKLEAARYSYDTVRAVDGVTLEIEGGRIVCLVGPNGSGKTTLLKLIASLIRPSSGLVYIDGKDARLYSPSEIARTVSFSDPHLPRTLPMRVVDFILTSRYPFQRTLQYFESEDDLRAVDSVVEELGIAHLLERRLDQLSSGELQRVVIAAALAKRPRVLLLDEPSAFLDVRSRFEIMDVVRRYTRERRAATVVALHDLYMASLYCDSIALLSRGRIAALGAPAEVFSSRVVEEVYGVGVKTVRVDGTSLVAIPLPPRSGN